MFHKKNTKVVGRLFTEDEMLNLLNNCYEAAFRKGLEMGRQGMGLKGHFIGPMQVNGKMIGATHVLGLCEVNPLFEDAPQRTTAAGYYMTDPDTGDQVWMDAS